MARFQTITTDEESADLSPVSTRKDLHRWIDV